jgi:uncharacterized damage-inducible protein DinB
MSDEVIMTRSTAPARTEAAEYFFRYITQVPPGDICQLLENQIEEVMGLLGPLSEEESLYRYAPDKWSIRQVVNHVNDCERVFASRAHWFARGLAEALPSLDQNAAAALADADARSLESHLEEFNAVRLSSLALFESLNSEAWTRQGIASGHPFTPRALAWITAGHLIHHLRGLKDHYLPAVLGTERAGVS